MPPFRRHSNNRCQRRHASAGVRPSLCLLHSRNHIPFSLSVILAHHDRPSLNIVLPSCHAPKSPSGAAFRDCHTYPRRWRDYSAWVTGSLHWSAEGRRPEVIASPTASHDPSMSRTSKSVRPYCRTSAPKRRSRSVSRGVSRMQTGAAKPVKRSCIRRECREAPHTTPEGIEAAATRSAGFCGL